MTALCNSGSTRAICASCAGSPLRYLMYSTGFTAEPSLGSTSVGLLAPETAPAPDPASGGFLMSMTTHGIRLALYKAWHSSKDHHRTWMPGTILGPGKVSDHHRH